jgi:hypothetical protein
VETGLFHLWDWTGIGSSNMLNVKSYDRQAVFDVEKSCVLYCHPESATADERSPRYDWNMLWRGSYTRILVKEPGYSD